VAFVKRVLRYLRGTIDQVIFYQGKPGTDRERNKCTWLL